MGSSGSVHLYYCYGVLFLMLIGLISNTIGGKSDRHLPSVIAGPSPFPPGIRVTSTTSKESELRRRKVHSVRSSEPTRSTTDKRATLKVQDDMEKEEDLEEFTPSPDADLATNSTETIRPAVTTAYRYPGAGRTHRTTRAKAVVSHHVVLTELSWEVILAVIFGSMAGSMVLTIVVYCLCGRPEEGHLI